MVEETISDARTRCFRKALGPKRHRRTFDSTTLTQDGIVSNSLRAYSGASGVHLPSTSLRIESVWWAQLWFLASVSILLMIAAAAALDSSPLGASGTIELFGGEGSVSPRPK